MKQAPRILAQLALYVPLMALIGFFSTEPAFAPVGTGEALVRLSLIHAAPREHECRQRSAEELAKLAPNMRAALDCPRERADILVELEVDGAPVLRRTVKPSGLHRDGNSAFYARLAVPAGRHRFVTRLRRSEKASDDYVSERTVELAPGRVLLIDFNATRGGFVFRG
jgi:hypothetical protein